MYILIDNIFTNNLSQNVFNGIVLNDLSDHLPVFTYFDNETLTRRREKKLPSRAINDINLEKFNEILSNTNWSLLITVDDPSEAYSPWLSRDLLKSINKKNSLYKKNLFDHPSPLMSYSTKPTKTN